MQLLNHKKLHVVAGRATQGLAADICHELGVTLGSEADSLAGPAEAVERMFHVKMHTRRVGLLQ